MNNQINIEEKKIVYDVTYTYHSDMKCQNYDMTLVGIEESDGKVTIKPGDNELAVGFIFEHSDPDRVIAIAQMMIGFAQAIKNKSKNTIDTDNEA